MTFEKFSSYLSRLEETTLRNSMVEILAELFKEATPSDISMICYLTQGRVAPLFEAVEFGLADKMMMRAMGEACEVGEDLVTKEYKQLGDLGLVVEKLKIINSKLKKSINNLKVQDVFEKLREIADLSGSGSVEKKIGILSGLLKNADGLSAKYIVKITLDKLRLGFSDMTVLQALALSTGLTMNETGRKKVRELKDKIEEKYNVRPDLGYIAKVIKEEGEKGLSAIQPTVGTPILMARAERLSTGAAIIEKIGKCAVEYKYDGFRCQVHKSGNLVEIFSRNLENTTTMYPDLVDGVLNEVVADEVIFEGEAIAFRPETGEFLPFQETVQRKRKYDIEKKALEIPLKLFAFDILYLNGESFLDKPFTKRREELSKILDKRDLILLSEEQEVSTPLRLENIFDEAITRGLEGIVAKRLDGTYAAGARNFNWIKLKRSYASKLDDNIDALVMGYDYGQGKRTGFGIGDFLIGVYDKKSDMFKTIAKIGTGLTDDEWKSLQVKSQKSKVKIKPTLFDVDRLMECDVWVSPQIMVVIKADEITRSPVHTAGREMEPSKSGSAFSVKTPGYALRFPRLVEFRNDKRPEDATSVEEIMEMYGLQKKMEIRG